MPKRAVVSTTEAIGHCIATIQQSTTGHAKRDRALDTLWTHPGPSWSICSSICSFVSVLLLFLCFFILLFLFVFPPTIHLPPPSQNIFILLETLMNINGSVFYWAWIVSFVAFSSTHSPFSKCTTRNGTEVSMCFRLFYGRWWDDTQYVYRPPAPFAYIHLWRKAFIFVAINCFISLARKTLLVRVRSSNLLLRYMGTWKFAYAASLVSNVAGECKVREGRWWGWLNGRGLASWLKIRAFFCIILNIFDVIFCQFCSIQNIARVEK